MPKTSLNHFRKIEPQIDARRRTLTFTLPTEVLSMLTDSRRTSSLRDFYWTVTNGVIQISANSPETEIVPLGLEASRFVEVS